jgi:hypothetical protein
VHFCTHSEDIEVGDVEDLELCHDGFGVAAGWYSADKADDSLLGFDEWLEVGFVRVAGSPDGDVADEVRVDEGIIELCHGFQWE